jgi:hypothetical protein
VPRARPLEVAPPSAAVASTAAMSGSGPAVAVACYEISVSDGITGAVRQFTESGVSRLEQLEVLLSMYLHPEAGWDAERVTRTFTINSRTAAEALAHLHKHGLLDLVKPEPPCYRLSSRVDLAVLGQLRKNYERDRTQVINAFFACNLDSLRSFTAAFRLRRPQ